MSADVSSALEVRANGRLGITHREKIRRAADCLASPAPAWLITVLSHFSFDVKTQHHIDASSPTRREQFDVNIQANEDARRLLEFLQKPFATEYLASQSSHSEELRYQLEPLLRELLVATHEAHKTLLDQEGKVPSGRGKARLPDGLPPAKYVCAAIVAEAAAFLGKNGFEMPSKSALYDAATELWTSLLPLEGWGDARRMGWKLYFQSADDSSLGSLRAEVRRWLSSEMSLFYRRK